MSKLIHYKLEYSSMVQLWEKYILFEPLHIVRKFKISSSFGNKRWLLYSTVILLFPDSVRSLWFSWHFWLIALVVLGTLLARHCTFQISSRTIYHFRFGCQLLTQNVMISQIRNGRYDFFGSNFLNYCCKCFWQFGRPSAANNVIIIPKTECLPPYSMSRSFFSNDYWN